jgi:hypothetical protein
MKDVLLPRRRCSWTSKQRRQVVGEQVAISLSLSWHFSRSPFSSLLPQSAEARTGPHVHIIAPSIVATLPSAGVASPLIRRPTADCFWPTAQPPSHIHWGRHWMLAESERSWKNMAGADPPEENALAYSQIRNTVLWYCSGPLFRWQMSFRVSFMCLPIIRAQQLQIRDNPWKRPLFLFRPRSSGWGTRTPSA